MSQPVKKKGMKAGIAKKNLKGIPCSRIPFEDDLYILFYSLKHRDMGSLRLFVDNLTYPTILVKYFPLQVLSCKYEELGLKFVR